MGLLYRRFYENSNPRTLLKLYCSFIRPHHEYAATVWSPHLIKDITAIEKVQKFALRVCLKDWSLDYDELLHTTSLPSLETRRQRARLCFLHNIVHNNIDFPNAPVAPRAANKTQQQLPTIVTSMPYQSLSKLFLP